MGWYFTIGAHQTKAPALEMEQKSQKLSSGQNSAEECHEMDAVATVTHQFQVFKNDLSPLRQFDLQTLSKKD